MRAQRERRVSKLLSLLAVFWLGAITQPCIAAFEADDQCPHCPMEMPELGIPEGCTFLDSSDSDGRVAGIDPTRDVPDETASAIVQFEYITPIRVATFATGPPTWDEATLPAPQLNTLYCVYLK